MFAIVHGIDLTSISKFEKMILNEGYVNRCFTTAEQKQCANRADRYAARFAAKEAVLKALSLGIIDGLSLTDVEVVFDSEGAPGIKLSGMVADRAATLGLTSWHLTFAHSGAQAVASVIGLVTPPDVTSPRL